MRRRDRRCKLCATWFRDGRRRQRPPSRRTGSPGIGAAVRPCARCRRQSRRPCHEANRVDGRLTFSLNARLRGDQARRRPCAQRARRDGEQGLRARCVGGTARPGRRRRHQASPASPGGRHLPTSSPVSAVDAKVASVATREHELVEQTVVEVALEVAPQRRRAAGG